MNNTLQIGVKILIKNSRDEYLFIKRSKLLASDTVQSWDIPGGRIEPSESLEAALQREVQEEIGHELLNKPSLVDAQDIFIEKKQLHVVRLTYIVKEDVPNIVLSDEHIDYAWFTPTHLKSMEFEPYLHEFIHLHIL